MALIPDFLVGKKIREENSKSKGQHWVSTEKKKKKLENEYGKTRLQLGK